MRDRQPNLANPAVHVQSWYVAARSGEVRRGRARTVAMLGRRIALYRAAEGTVYALDARCPHLGADLGQGQVIGDELRCAFHGWRYGPDGHGRAAPGLREVPPRRVRAYPVQERWGFVWLWNGPAPTFDLPAPPPGKPVRVVAPPSQTIHCHPHLVIANGLDARHFEALHGMALSEPATLAVEPPLRVTVGLRGRPVSTLLQHLTGTQEHEIVARFTTIGGALAWAEIESPTRFWTLFTGRPTPEGHCRTQVILFLPPTVKQFGRSLASMYTLLRDDRRILDRLHFFPGFTDADAPLAAFAEVVNGMETG